MPSGQSRWVPFVIPQPAWWAAPLALALYGGWCVAYLLRIAAALVALGRAKQACRPFPEIRSSELCGWTTLRSAGRRTALVVSDDVRAAAVLGLTSPRIALSPAIVRALSDQELDAIVVHEWAHIQRRDDWAQLVQLIVRAFAGLHPAVWWIDRQLHVERETACDDWAVSLTGSSRRFAASLAKVATLSARQTHPVLLPSVLTSDLARRVARLLDARRSTATRPRMSSAALVSPVLLLTAFGVASVDLVVSATSSSSPSTSIAVLPRVDMTSPPAATRRHARVPATPVPDGRSTTGGRPAQGQQQKSAPLTQSTAPRPTTIDPPVAAEDASPVPGIAAPSSGVNVSELPGSVTSVPTLLPASVVDGSRPSAPSATNEPTPWGAAADAGVGIGRGSQKAAVATAGFFTKLSKSIARSF